MSEKELRKEISIRFKKMRDALGFSQEKMGANMGAARPSIANYERGDAFPNLESIKMLANNFDISLDWLIAEKGPMFFAGKAQQEAGVDREELPDNIGEIFDIMLRVPAVRYGMLSYFYKMKNLNPEIMEFSEIEKD
ncbi:MAG: helix-turn-helix transcriptional regulator [Candidatus Aminicenantes bacterium]|nr:helix-turn-helix transcriptional regulator [Candidatus Aminicenantes bacterium]